MAFMASRCSVACSGLCPPERKTIPGTAAGTVRRRQRTVASATSWTLACLGQDFPERIMLGLSNVPSSFPLPLKRENEPQIQVSEGSGVFCLLPARLLHLLKGIIPQGSTVTRPFSSGFGIRSFHLGPPLPSLLLFSYFIPSNVLRGLNSAQCLDFFHKLTPCQKPIDRLASVFHAFYFYPCGPMFKKNAA